MLKIVHSAINTKALSRWSELACGMALDAVLTVEMEESGRREIDIKKYAKVEKVRNALAAHKCAAPHPGRRPTASCRARRRFPAASSKTRAC